MQLRHVATLKYGDSLAAEDRIDGDVPVYGSNGPVGNHDRPNTQGPVIVVGRKGSYGRLQFSITPVFAIDTTYFIDATCTQVDLRWLYYALSTLKLHASSLDVGVPGLSRELAYAKRLRVPTLPQQRAIADYLDTETARIDALITKKRRLINLLNEHEQRALVDGIGDWRAKPSMSIRQAGVTVLTGPFGTVLSADEYVDGGVPLINPTHIKNGTLIPEESVSVPEEVALRISRHRLRVGDLVMGRKGDVGRSALVAQENEGWLCGSDSIAIRCDGSDLDPVFLELLLHIGLYRQQLAKFSTGATLANVNEAVLLSLSVPAHSRPTQAALVEQLTRIRVQTQRGTHLLTRQIHLLAERRQALITTAVAGELDVQRPLETEIAPYSSVKGR
jgi:type I restriction enzyme S subunit